jgi:hypothetical protein
MPTLMEHLAVLHRERKLTSDEVRSLLDVRDRWDTYLSIDAELEVAARFRYNIEVEDALTNLGKILREAGRQIAESDASTPYGVTEAMTIRSVVTRWVIDRLAGYLDAQQKRAVHAEMRRQKLAR